MATCIVAVCIPSNFVSRLLSAQSIPHGTSSRTSVPLDDDECAEDYGRHSDSDPEADDDVVNHWRKCSTHRVYFYEY